MTMATTTKRTIESSRPPWHSAVSGCVAGAGARMAVAPLDLIRIRLQLEPQKPLISIIKQVAREGGVAGFFRGNIPATYLYTGYSAVQFFAYSRITNQLQRETSLPPPAIAFFAGASGGVLATLCTYPFDICRTNFAAKGMNDVGSPKTMWDFSKQLYQQHGVRGFFAGAGPGVTGIIPYMGLNFLIYETLMGVEDARTAVNAATAGAISGGVSKLAVYPLDTAKKRLQVQAFYTSNRRQSYKGMVDCLATIVKTEGVASLYRGIIPSVLKNTVATSLSFALYTVSMNVLDTAQLRTRQVLTPCPTRDVKKPNASMQ